MPRHGCNQEDYSPHGENNVTNDCRDFIMITYISKKPRSIDVESTRDTIIYILESKHRATEHEERKSQSQQSCIA